MSNQQQAQEFFDGHSAHVCPLCKSVKIRRIDLTPEEDKYFRNREVTMNVMALAIKTWGIKPIKLRKVFCKQCEWNAIDVYMPD